LIATAAFASRSADRAEARNESVRGFNELPANMHFWLSVRAKRAGTALVPATHRDVF